MDKNLEIETNAESDQNARQHYYNGHSIFRNQPPHTWFDKPFDEGFDMLYCCLNEISPYFLENKDELNDDVFTCSALVDPRTNSIVEKTLIDHTAQSGPPIFKFVSFSNLTALEHRTRLSVIRAFKEKQNISSYQVEILDRSEKKLREERIRFMEFLLHYCHINHEEIYSHARILVDMYKRFYRKKVKSIMQNFKDEIFIIQTGLPHPKYCGTNEIVGHVINVKIEERKGAVAVWGTQYNLKQIRPRLENFFEIYCNSIKNQSQSYGGKVRSSAQFVIPSETLLFLMCTGEYVDVPTETLITVCEKEENEKIFIEFEVPLPSRSCGLNTNLFVVESAFQAYISLPDKASWLHLDDKNCTDPKETQCNEIDAAVRKNTTYKVYTHDDYMENIPLNIYQTLSNVCSNSCKVVWKLKLKSEGERELDILTNSSFPIAVDIDGNSIIHGHSVKLEYKSKFGCEYATKVELLRDWISLKFFESMSGLTKHRIDIETFSEQLQETVTLDDIERQLATHYSVQTSRLLGGLGVFLELLEKVPPGNYMLRYLPKYKDKLMLCAPSKEAVRTSVSIYSLFNEEPSDLAFFIHPTVLPISDSLYSVMHKYHQVLPCTFPPSKKQNPRFQKNPKKRQLRLIDDKEYIMTKVRNKAQQLEAKKKINDAKQKLRKRLKQRRHQKIKNAAKRKERAELAQIRKEIEVDKQFYGFKGEE